MLILGGREARIGRNDPKGLRSVAQACSASPSPRFNPTIPCEDCRLPLALSLPSVALGTSATQIVSRAILRELLNTLLGGFRKP